MNLNEVIDISKALLTPAIGVLAAVIAYNQWKTAEAKRRMELFERRYKIYSSASKLESDVILYLIETEEEIDEFIATITDLMHLILENYHFFRLPDKENLKRHNERLCEIFVAISYKKESVNEYIIKVRDITSDIQEIVVPYIEIENSSLLEKLFPTVHLMLNEIISLLSFNVFEFNTNYLFNRLIQSRWLKFSQKASITQVSGNKHAKHTSQVSSESANVAVSQTQSKSITKNI